MSSKPSCSACCGACVPDKGDKGPSSLFTLFLAKKKERNSKKSSVRLFLFDVEYCELFYVRTHFLCDFLTH